MQTKAMIIALLEKRIDLSRLKVTAFDIIIINIPVNNMLNCFLLYANTNIHIFVFFM